MPTANKTKKKSKSSRSKKSSKSKNKTRKNYLDKTITVIMTTSDIKKKN